MSFCQVIFVQIYTQTKYERDFTIRKKTEHFNKAKNEKGKGIFETAQTITSFTIYCNQID